MKSPAAHLTATNSLAPKGPQCSVTSPTWLRVQGSWRVSTNALGGLYRGINHNDRLSGRMQGRRAADSRHKDGVMRK